MSYVFEKYSAGSSGGTADNGFFVLNGELTLGGDFNGTVTVPEDLPVADIKTLHQIILLIDNVYYTFESLDMTKGVAVYVGVLRQDGQAIKCYMDVNPEDFTFVQTKIELLDDTESVGFVVLEAAFTDLSTDSPKGYINIPENFDINSVALMHNVLVTIPNTSQLNTHFDGLYFAFDKLEFINATQIAVFKLELNAYGTNQINWLRIDLSTMQFVLSIEDDSDSNGGGLPEVTETDNGKVLMVVDGSWQATSLSIYAGEYEVIE